LNDIRSGPQAKKSRGRGLTDKHILRFFDPTLWKELDDSANVSAQ
jgi:hypothetical protein